MKVNQGDIFWVAAEPAADGETGIAHPYVVIQDDLLNHSRIQTVAACALTSNLRRISLPGNVLLDVGEANLPRQSVVEVAKVTTVEKSRLGDRIGTLSAARIGQILDGLRFLQRSGFTR